MTKILSLEAFNFFPLQIFDMAVTITCRSDCYFVVFLTALITRFARERVLGFLLLRRRAADA